MKFNIFNIFQLFSIFFNFLSIFFYFSIFSIFSKWLPKPEKIGFALAGWPQKSYFFYFSIFSISSEDLKISGSRVSGLGSRVSDLGISDLGISVLGSWGTRTPGAWAADQLYMGARGSSRRQDVSWNSIYFNIFSFFLYQWLELLQCHCKLLQVCSASLASWPESQVSENFLNIILKKIRKNSFGWWRRTIICRV